jgi:hypothetical protein
MLETHKEITSDTILQWRIPPQYEVFKISNVHVVVVCTDAVHFTSIGERTSLYDDLGHVDQAQPYRIELHNITQLR